MKHTYIGKPFFICRKLLFSSAARGFICSSLRALFQRKVALYGNGPLEGLEKTMWKGLFRFFLQFCVLRKESHLFAMVQGATGLKKKNHTKRICLLCSGRHELPWTVASLSSAHSHPKG